MEIHHIPKIRLVTVPAARPSAPYGPKTQEFIRNFLANPRLNTQLIEDPSLPHFSYCYQTYYPYDYSQEKAEDIFQQHLVYYTEQIRTAFEQGETIVLISGRYHEFTAPFLVAIQTILDQKVKVASFDQHLDCFGKNRFAAGSFFRWLIEKQYLDPQDLTMVGIPPFNINNNLSAMIYELFPGAIEDPLTHYTEIVEKLTIAEIQKRIISNFDNLDELRQDLIKKHCINKVALCLERLWVHLQQIRIINDPEYIPAENVLLSFDADISHYDYSTTYLPYFEKINTLVGIHIAELDSPDCIFDMSRLSQHFVNMLTGTNHKISRCAGSRSIITI